jgi:transcription elongation factor Elf1
MASMGGRKTSTKSKKKTTKAKDEDLDRKYLCPYCCKEKGRDGFYVSSDPLVLTGLTTMCKDCAKNIARNFNEDTGEYGDCTKASIQAALERLDKPWLESIYESSYAEVNNPDAGLKRTNVWSAYIKNITSLGQYKGMRWRDGDLFTTYQVSSKIAENPEEAYEATVAEEEKTIFLTPYSSIISNRTKVEYKLLS